MFMMVDYGREMSVKKSCMAIKDRFRICSSRITFYSDE